LEISKYSTTNVLKQTTQKPTPYNPHLLGKESRSASSPFQPSPGTAFMARFFCPLLGRGLRGVGLLRIRTGADSVLSHGIYGNPLKIFPSRH
jgi:hypothetical protein